MSLWTLMDCYSYCCDIGFMSITSDAIASTTADGVIYAFSRNKCEILSFLFYFKPSISSSPLSSFSSCIKRSKAININTLFNCLCFFICSEKKIHINCANGDWELLHCKGGGFVLSTFLMGKKCKEKKVMDWFLFAYEKFKIKQPLSHQLLKLHVCAQKVFFRSKILTL